MEEGELRECPSAAFDLELGAARFVALSLLPFVTIAG